MADPLSISGSIAGLVSLADTVFRYAFKFARSAAGAKEEITAISTEINGLSDVMRHLRALAGELEDEGDEFEPALRVDSLTQCQQTLDTIQKRLKKAMNNFESQSKWEGIQRRLKWPFSASETKDLLADISRHKENLMLATSADTMRKLQKHLSKQEERDEKLGRAVASIERVEINTKILLDDRKKLVLDFFMKPEANPQSHLVQSIRLRHPTTGGWLLGSEIFTEWLQTPNSRLWLNGIPGGGKTVLAGAVIQEALSRSSSKTGVAFFFCDYKMEKLLTPVNILGALASQFARQSEDAFELLQKYYTELHPARALDKMPDADELRVIIGKISGFFGQVIIVVDGLDECGENTNDVIESLIELSDTTDTTSIALFSRDELGIRIRLEDQFDEISIEANTGDIELYVRAEIEQRVQTGRLALYNVEIKDEIREQLVKRANGMFRWVVCQLDYLCEMATDADRREALRELPPTLSDCYLRLLQRVNRRPPRMRKLVQMCLHFITLFPGKLSIVQLCQAVSVPETIGSSLDGSNTVTEREIAFGCSSLIRKSEDGSSFEVAHFSVREFLEDDLLLQTPGLEIYRISKEGSHPLLALQCVKFLQLGNFSRQPSRDLTYAEYAAERKKIYQAYPFYTFAAVGWPLLVREGLNDGSLLQAVKSLFLPAKSAYFRAWIEGLVLGILHYSHRQDATEETAAYFSQVAATFAHDSTLKPLHFAAALNMSEMCAFLIGMGAKIDVQSSWGTPLVFAQISFLGLLQKLNFFPNFYVPTLQTILPSSKLRNKSIEYLIKAGAGVSDLLEYSGKSSIFAMTNIIGCQLADLEPTIRLLSNGIIPTEDEIEEFNTYLEVFSRNEDNRNLEKPILDLLHYLKGSSAYDSDWGLKLGSILWKIGLSRGYTFADHPDLTDTRISLSEDALKMKIVVAIEYDDADTLQTCLEDGRITVQSSITSPNGYNGPILYVAIRRNSSACVKLLLSAGGDPLSEDSNGNLAIHCCDPRRDVSSLKILAHHEVSLLSQNSNRENLWHVCANYDEWSFSFMDALFNLDLEATKAALLVKEHNECTPLELVLFRYEDIPDNIRTQREERALFFLRCCNQIPQFWADHDYIFSAGAKFGSHKVLEQLIEWGIRPEPQEPDKPTPLHHIHPTDSIELVQVLKDLYPEALGQKFEGKLPIQRYVETCVKSSVSMPYDMIGLLTSEDIFRSRDQYDMTLWESACGLLDRDGHIRDGFSTGWPLLSWLLENLYRLNAIKFSDDTTGRCGLYPPFKFMIKYSISLGTTMDFLCEKPLDELISSSNHWDPSDEVVVQFTKHAIATVCLPAVRVLLNRGANVHQRIGLTAIEFACNYSALEHLFSQTDGKEILQALLDHSDPVKLRDFPPEDAGGLSILHRIATTSEEPELRWLIKELVEKGADINAANTAATEEKAVPPIVHHLISGSFYCAEFLLELGANLDMEVDYYNVATLAVDKGNHEFLQRVIDRLKVTCTELSLTHVSYSWVQFEGNRFDMDDASDLHVASHYGNLECARIFLDEKLIDVDHATRLGITPLHVAALCNKTNLIELLIERGAAINRSCSDGSTALHFAARNGHLESTKALAHLGALNSIDQNAKSPRMYADDAGYSEIAQLLDEVFGEVGRLTRRATLSREQSRSLLRQLESAIMEDNLEDCKSLFVNGCPLDTSLPQCNGCSPLLLALRYQSLETTKWLLDKGVDVLKVSCDEDDSESAIELASRFPSLSTVFPTILNLYTRSGGDWVDGVDSPFHFAIHYNNEECLRVLLDYLVQNEGNLSRVWGDNVRQRILNVQFSFQRHSDNEFQDMTALHLAVDRGNSGAVTLLLEHGANIDAVDSNGLSVLAYARSSDMALLLINSGASPSPLFNHTLEELISRWRPDTTTMLNVFFIKSLEGVAIKPMDILCPSASSNSICCPLSISFDDLTPFLALENMGISLSDIPLGDGKLINQLLGYPTGQSFFLSSKYSIDSLPPYPWHWETTQTMLMTPFLSTTFRQFKRKYPRDSLQRWMNLQPSRGWSPLCRAASMDRAKIIENCLSIGAEIDFEGCALGSALIIASACGCLNAVKLLVQRGAAISYHGRRGPVNAISVAKSKAVVSWLLVGQFKEQLKIADAMNDTEACFPRPVCAWSGILPAKMRVSGRNIRQPEESTFDYAVGLGFIKRGMRGRVALTLEELVYQ